MPIGCSGIKNGCAAKAAHPNFFVHSVINACHSLQYLILLLVQAFFHGKSFRNINIDHLSGLRADHAVGLALGQYLDRLIAHAAGHDAVTRRWRAAALDMAEDRHARVEPKFLMDPLADLDCAACTLGDNDHEVRIACKPCLPDAVNHVAVKIDRLFRHQNRRRAGGEADVKRQMARVAAHDLNDRAALMRLHRVTQAVNGLDSGIGRRVVTDGIIGADNVVVNRGRNADDRNALLRKFYQTPERAVAANGNNAVQPKQLAGSGSFFLPLKRAEFIAARRVEHRTAAIDDMRDIAVFQNCKIAVDQTVIAAADADAFDSHVGARTHDRADGCIHAGGIAAGGQNTDSFHCICHTGTSSQFNFFHHTPKQWKSKQAIARNRRSSAKNQSSGKIYVFFAAGVLYLQYIHKGGGSLNQTGRILEEVKKAVCGKDRVLVWVLTVLLARGHVLLEDIPGVGKTTMALAFSRALGLEYGRVQFTPDVLPSDITGYSVYQKEIGRLVYQPGAVLCNLFLADELNRATSRTQSALLEAMEEGQVTVDGVSHPIPQPFIVFATQNPTGAAGTQLLPDSQMDRFAVRLSIGYPAPEDERNMVLARQGVNPLQSVRQVLSREELIAMQDEAAAVYIKTELIDYIVALIDATRNHAMILRGASPRATLSLTAMAKAVAYVQRRDYVVPKDIQVTFPQVIAHRLLLAPEAGTRQITPEQLLDEILRQVSAPRL